MGPASVQRKHTRLGVDEPGWHRRFSRRKPLTATVIVEESSPAGPGGTSTRTAPQQWPSPRRRTGRTIELEAHRHRYVDDAERSTSGTSGPGAVGTQAPSRRSGSGRRAPNPAPERQQSARSLRHRTAPLCAPTTPLAAESKSASARFVKHVEQLCRSSRPVRHGPPGPVRPIRYYAFPTTSTKRPNRPAQSLNVASCGRAFATAGEHGFVRCVRTAVTSSSRTTTWWPTSPKAGPTVGSGARINLSAYDVERPAKLNVDNIARAAHRSRTTVSGRSLPANERYGNEEPIKG